MKRLMYKVVTITLLETAKEALVESGLYMNDFNVHLYFSLEKYLYIISTIFLSGKFGDSLIINSYI